MFQQGIYVYNDLKSEDYLNNLHLIKDTNFIINDDKTEKHALELIKKNADRVYFKVNIYGDWRSELEYAKKVGFEYIAVDAENYKKDLKYSYELGEVVRTTIEYLGFNHCILLPEYLGGEKYEGYEEFIKGLDPFAVLMERTYNVWKPWDIYRFYKRSKHRYTFIGIWPETLPKICRWIQEISARIISGEQIFWYSETKSMPRIKR